VKKALFLCTLFVICAAFVGAQTVTVTKPAAGQTVLKEEICHILWTKNGTMPGLVRISLRNSQTLAEVLLIADNAANSGSFDWLVPKSIPDGTYVIRVKVKDAAVQDDSGSFPLHGAQPSGPSVVQRTPMADKVGPIGLLGKPTLSISGAGLVVYSDSFRITFAYKNSGTGNLPKSSEMPVKPNFRVLVDGNLLNQGNLTIPAFPAQPGWEMPSYYGGEIKLPGAAEWDPQWKIGNSLVIYINENKVNGMAGDTKTYDLKKLALGYAFDAFVAGAAYMWNTENLTVTVHIDGPFGNARKFRLYSSGSGSNEFYVDAGQGGFMEEHDLVPGKHDYLITHKVHLPNQAANSFDTWIGVFVVKSTDNYPDQHDLDHPNNIKKYHFQR
jgi:hypothetical protein